MTTPPRRRTMANLPSRVPTRLLANYKVLENVGNKHKACPKHFNPQGKLKVNITNTNRNWTRCPITMNKASNPHIIVGDTTGTVYNKNALKQWFNSGSKKNPMTGQQINNVKIAPLPKELRVLGDWNGRTKSNSACSYKTKSTRPRSYQPKPKPKRKIRTL